MEGAGARSFDAVLFDWCGTLVEYPTVEDRFEGALRRLGRDPETSAVAGMVAGYARARQHPEVIDAATGCDLSPRHHRTAKLLACDIAGIDHEVAADFERSFADLETYPIYPEVAGVFAALVASGVKLAIVSDVHVDIRPQLASIGVLDLVSGVVLSCEVGEMKPAPAVFHAAIEAVDTPPSRCLMVGDNPGTDAGAAALGVATLILPFQRSARPRLLERVLPLVFENPEGYHAAANER